MSEKLFKLSLSDATACSASYTIVFMFMSAFVLFGILGIIGMEVASDSKSTSVKEFFSCVIFISIFSFLISLLLMGSATVLTINSKNNNINLKESYVSRFGYRKHNPYMSHHSYIYTFHHIKYNQKRIPQEWRHLESLQHHIGNASSHGHVQKFKRYIINRDKFRHYHNKLIYQIRYDHYNLKFIHHLHKIHSSIFQKPRWYNYL